MLGSTAVLDACVLYPASLRDFLLRLASAGLYSPRWSAVIHAEWTSNLLADRPDITPAQLARTQSLMDIAVPTALVTGHEPLIEGLTNHPKDRHVLAVAIQGQASLIITFNLKDFPATTLSPHGVRAIHPDAFTLSLYQSNPTDMVKIIQRHRAQLTRPPKNAQEYLDTLGQCHLRQTASVLQKHLDEL
nr:PIN domain-containing protein [Armatimonas sp.]